MEGSLTQPPSGYGGSAEWLPPPAQLPPQFHLFPSNSPPFAFTNNLNPNIFLPNTLPFHTPTTHLQIPSINGQVFSFPPQHQNPIFHPPLIPSFHGQTNQNLGLPQSRRDAVFSIEIISEQVVRVRRELIAGAHNVSAWKVLQSVLIALKLESWESWESLGFQMQEIPPLRNLIETERKINTFIQCFIAARSITTLYELKLAICKNEGVDNFEEFELGPFLRHPLVIHYFSLDSNTNEVLKITSGDILSRIHKFLINHEYNEAKIDELLGSILENSLTSREKLNVRIQSLGEHITCIWKELQAENVTLKKYVAGLNPISGLNVRKCPLISSQKRELDDRFKDLSQRVESFTSANVQFCGEHKRFSYSSDEDDSKDKPASCKAKSNSKTSPSVKVLDIESNGPSRNLTSKPEELTQLTSKPEELTQLTSKPSSCSCDSSSENDTKDETEFEDKVLTIVSNGPSPSTFEQKTRLTSKPASCSSDSSSENDSEDETDFEDIKTGSNSQSNSKSYQNLLLPRVGNCPYPSVTEERVRLNIKPEKNTRGVNIIEISDDDDDDDGDDSADEDIKPGNNAQCSSKPYQNVKMMDQVSNTSNRSASKEMTQLGLKPDGNASTSANKQDKMKSGLQNNKRKFDERIGKSPLPHKIPKTHQGETNVHTAKELKEPVNQDTADPTLVSESTRVFPETWKEACCNNGVEESKHIRLKRPCVGRTLDAEANTSHQIQNALETDAQEEADVAEIEMVSSLKYEQGKGQEHYSSRVLYSSRDVEISDLHQPDDNAAVTENDGSRTSMKQTCPIFEQQAELNGRLGELVAHKYFIERAGEENVNWVNEKNETGLPYDIIVGSEEEGSQEYIEVKATTSLSKNWFELSSSEWQFATEKGESFSVAHVVLLGNNTAKVTIYKNLAKLLRLNMVRLAVLMFNPNTINS